MTCVQNVSSVSRCNIQFNSQSFDRVIITTCCSITYINNDCIFFYSMKVRVTANVLSVVVIVLFYTALLLFYTLIDLLQRTIDVFFISVQWFCFWTPRPNAYTDVYDAWQKLLYACHFIVIVNLWYFEASNAANSGAAYYSRSATHNVRSTVRSRKNCR